MQLDTLRRCPHHPNEKLKGVAYELPDYFEARKRQMLRERHWKKVNNTRNMVLLVSILALLIITYYLILK
jgi:hypothetical protein